MLARIRTRHIAASIEAHAFGVAIEPAEPDVTPKDLRDAELDYKALEIAELESHVRWQNHAIAAITEQREAERRRNKLLYGVLVALMVLAAFLGGAYSRARGQVEMRAERVYWEAR